jgi:anti-sigma regulatory factor (Ser/Thr protein kinase)
LDGELDAERKADASLLLHELVANSVIHAGADTSQSIGVQLRIDEAAVRIAVTDNGSVSIPSVPAHDAARDGGRGLRLVEALSDAWGMEREGIRRTTMWFEMRRDDRRPG